MSKFSGVSAVLASVLAGAVLTLLFWRPALTVSRGGLTRAALPTRVAGFDAAGDHDADPAVQAALPGATILTRDYRNGGAGVGFTLVSATSRDGIHDPRLCLTGAGWRLSDEHPEHLRGTGVTMQVCQAATQAGPPDALVGYFYVVNGHVISSPTQIRAGLLWSALLGRQSAPTYFLRFMLPLGGDPGAARRQDAQMQAFAAQMWQTLRPRIVSTASARRASQNGGGRLIRAPHLRFRINNRLTLT